MNEQQRKELGVVVVVSGTPDDDAPALAALTAAGFEIQAVAEAKRVLSLKDMMPRGWLPAVIVVDAIIPKSSGFELIRALSNLYDPNKVLILMMSKYKSREDELEAGSAGARGMLVKPITPEALDGFIEKERMRRMKAQIAGKVIAEGL